MAGFGQVLQGHFAGQGLRLAAGPGGGRHQPPPSAYGSRPAHGAPAVAQPRRVGNATELPRSFSAAGGRHPGQPLPDAVRSKMEAVFNASFADVRVHVGQEAPSIGALAFTIGSNLYFAPGQYDPHSSRGQQILGHELTHVIQQRSGRVRNPFGAGVAVVQDPGLEAEAERMSRRVLVAPPPSPARPVQAVAQAAPQAVQCMKRLASKVGNWGGPAEMNKLLGYYGSYYQGLNGVVSERKKMQQVPPNLGDRLAALYANFYFAPKKTPTLLKVNGGLMQSGNAVVFDPHNKGGERVEALDTIVLTEASEKKGWAGHAPGFWSKAGAMCHEFVHHCLEANYLAYFVKAIAKSQEPAVSTYATINPGAEDFAESMAMFFVNSSKLKQISPARYRACLEIYRMEFPNWQKKKMLLLAIATGMVIAGVSTMMGGKGDGQESKV